MPKINNTSYKWRVDPKPTGLARVYYKRRWPYIEESNGRQYLAGYIVAEEEYTPQNAKREDLKLSVVIYDWSNPIKRLTRKSKVEHKSLAAAKSHLESLINKYPNFALKEIK